MLVFTCWVRVVWIVCALSSFAQFLTFVFDMLFVHVLSASCKFWYFLSRFCICSIMCCLKHNAECFAPFSATLRRMLQVFCLIFVYFVCVWCGVLRTSIYDPSHNATSPGVSPRSQELWNGAKHSLIALKIKQIGRLRNKYVVGVWL